MEEDKGRIRQEDALTLGHLGYTQELARRMSGFSNFAMTFSVIGLLLGLTANFQAGFSVVGGMAVGVTWIVGAGFAFIVSATLGQIASAYPTAGGLYHWSSILGGRGLGWVTAWLNLISYVFSLASVNVALYNLFTSIILNGLFGTDTSTWGAEYQIPAVIAITVSQAILNHLGVKLLAMLSNVGAYLNLGGCILLFVLLLCGINHLDITSLFAFTNYSGDAGGGVVPKSDNAILLFGLSMIFPLWIMTSFDASAHASEETIDAARSVPRAMMFSVAISAVVGLVIGAAFIFAMPDQGKVAAAGTGAFGVLLASLPVPEFLKDAVSICIVATTYICGLCILTGCSRAMFAFARDGGLPHIVRRISPFFKTPAIAIWLSAALAVAATLYSPAFTSLSAGTAAFYYVSYALPALAGLVSLRRGWSRKGPFSLGLLFAPAAILSITGAIVVAVIAAMPPNDILRNYYFFITAALAIIWWGFERRRFRGPPATLLQGERSQSVRASVTG